MPAKIDVAALRKVPIFSSMSDAELQAILGAPENGLEQYETKQLIIREMEVAQCMYVILDGSVEVSLRGEDNFGREVVIATLRAGDFFGEQALSENTTTGRRSASVRCQVPAKLFRIDKKYVKLGVKRDRLGSEDQTITRMSIKDKEVRDLVKSMAPVPTRASTRSLAWPIGRRPGPLDGWQLLPIRCRSGARSARRVGPGYVQPPRVARPARSGESA